MKTMARRITNPKIIANLDVILREESSGARGMALSALLRLAEQGIPDARNALRYIGSEGSAQDGKAAMAILQRLPRLK
jgi:hypothetical protein